MDSFLFYYSLLARHDYKNADYEELSDEEKSYMEYVNNSLFHESEKVSDACTHMMLLVLKVASKLGTNDEISNEEIYLERKNILSNLSDEEIEKVETFGYACTKVIGIYSEESKNERKLRKERK